MKKAHKEQVRLWALMRSFCDGMGYEFPEEQAAKAGNVKKDKDAALKHLFS